MQLDAKQKLVNMQPRTVQDKKYRRVKSTKMGVDGKHNKKKR